VINKYKSQYKTADTSKRLRLSRYDKVFST